MPKYFFLLSYSMGDGSNRREIAVFCYPSDLMARVDYKSWLGAAGAYFRATGCTRVLRDVICHSVSENLADMEMVGVGIAEAKADQMSYRSQPIQVEDSDFVDKQGDRQ
jgi:hypothetical protein